MDTNNDEHSSEMRIGPAADAHKASRPARNSKGNARVNFRKVAKAVVKENFSTIIKSLAKKCESGSLSHVKYLFELGGVKEELQRPTRTKKQPSIADMLIAEVYKHKSRCPAGKEAPCTTEIDDPIGEVDGNDEIKAETNDAAERTGDFGANEQ